MVEAFFPVDAPVGAVTLRRTQPLDAEGDSAQAGVDDADRVTLTVNGTTTAFQPDPDHPGRYVPEDSLVLETGDTYVFEAEWRGQTATAEGTAPPPIQVDDVQLSIPSAPIEAVDVGDARRDSLDIPAEEIYIYPIEVQMAWERPAPATDHWIHTQLRTDDPQEIGVVDLFLQPEEVFPEQDASGTGNGGQWNGVYAVSVEDEGDALPAHQLRVALVRGDDAYAAFASTRGDPDRREPQSNVSGALGVASAVAVDTIQVEVEAP